MRASVDNRGPRYVPVVVGVITFLIGLGLTAALLAIDLGNVQRRAERQLDLAAQGLVELVHGEILSRERHFIGLSDQPGTQGQGVGERLGSLYEWRDVAGVGFAGSDTAVVEWSVGRSSSLPTSIAKDVEGVVTDWATRETVHIAYGNLMVVAYPGENGGVRTWDLMALNMTIAATEAVPEELVANVTWTLRPLEPNEILSGSARLVHREYLMLDETSTWLFELQWTGEALEEMGVGLSSLGTLVGVALSATLALLTSGWVHRHHVYVELEAAESIMEQKELLLLALSHQLRTPLTAVIGFLGLVLDDQTDMGGSQQRELLDLAKHQAEDAADIVEDLMVAARIQDENLMLLPKPIAVLPVVEAAFSASSGVDEALELVQSEPEAVVFADALRIRQLIRNVFDEGRGAGARNWGVTATVTERAVDIVFLGDFKIVANRHTPGISLEQVATPESRAAVRPHLTTATRLAEVMGGGITTLTVGGATAIHVLLPRPPLEAAEPAEPLAAVGF